MPILRASHPTEGLREASWAGWVCGLRVPDRCGSARSPRVRLDAITVIDLSNIASETSDAIARRCRLRLGPTGRPAPSPEPRTKRNPQIPVRGAERCEVVAVRHHRHRLDIGTQPSTANVARLRASLGCPSPKPRRLSPDGAFGVLLQPDRHA